MTNGDGVTVRDYVERIFDEREKALNIAFGAEKVRVELAFKAQQDALALASRILELRLEKLNDLRQEVTTDRGRYLTKEQYASDLKALNQKIDDGFRTINGWQDRMDGGLSLLRVLSVGGGFALLIEIARAFKWVQ